MKKALVMVLTLAMVLALCACGQQAAPAAPAASTGSASSGDATPAEGGLKIGFCASDSTNPVFIKCENWLTEQCAKDGNTLMTQYFETDSSKFLDICENFITAQCDIMIVQDPDEQISDDVLGRAQEAGIIVCTLDTDNPHSTYVQKDQNGEAGHLLASVIIDYINNNLGGSAKMVSYACPQSETMKVRNEVIAEDVIAACPGSEVVVEIDVWNVNADWVGLGETSLQAAPDAYVIYSVADVCTLGALEAYKAQGKTSADGYAAFSFDATAAACEEMQQEGSILNTSIYMGYPDVVAKMYTAAVQTAKTGEVGERYCAAELLPVNASNAAEIN